MKKVFGPSHARCVTLVLHWITLATNGHGRCTPGMSAPADTCVNAPLIAITGTYCSNTGDYTPDNPNWLDESPVFGGYTIENNAFYTFVANSPSMEFRSCSINCNNGFLVGSQFLILSSAFGGPAAKVFLIPQLYQGVGLLSSSWVRALLARSLRRIRAPVSMPTRPGK